MRVQERHSYVAVVGRGNNILKLLGSEDINADKVTFSVPMFSSFGSGDLNNLSKREDNFRQNTMK